MAAFRAGARVVGDLVGRPSRRRQALLGRLEQLGGPGRARHDQLAAPRGGVKGGPFLDGQLIDREMLRVPRQDLVELVPPGAPVLAGPGVDQVAGDPGKALAGQRQGGQRLGRVVAPPQEAQGVVVERLDAEREAVDPGPPEAVESGRLGRGRVGLQGDLDLGRQGPVLRDPVQHGLGGARRHQRGRAAAEEHAGHPAPLRFGSEMVQLAQQGAPPQRLVDRGPDVAVEVAVGALGAAERPVDVDRQAGVERLGARLPARRRGGRGAHEKTAATSCSKARARWLMACFRSGSISPKVMSWPSGRNTGS